MQIQSIPKQYSKRRISSLPQNFFNVFYYHGMLAFSKKTDKRDEWSEKQEVRRTDDECFSSTLSSAAMIASNMLVSFNKNYKNASNKFVTK